MEEDLDGAGGPGSGSSSLGQSLSRVCVLEMKAQLCLYDLIYPGDEDLWLENEGRQAETEDSVLSALPVSGTKREREKRQELVKLIELFFQLMRDFGQTGVVKACFQVPERVKQKGGFTVAFEPHFGTPARTRRNETLKQASMIFGQSTMEVALYNEESLVACVFYGHKCRKSAAQKLAFKLIDSFTEVFGAELRALREEFDQISHGKRVDVLDDTTLLDRDPDLVRERKQDRIMRVFHSKFNGLAQRLISNVVAKTRKNVDGRRQTADDLLLAELDAEDDDDSDHFDIDTSRMHVSNQHRRLFQVDR